MIWILMSLDHHPKYQQDIIISGDRICISAAAGMSELYWHGKMRFGHLVHKRSALTLSPDCALLWPHLSLINRILLLFSFEVFSAPNWIKLIVVLECGLKDRGEQPAESCVCRSKD